MAERRPAGYPKLKNYKPSRFMLPTSHYDKAKADRAVKFIENLCHTKGKWAGKRFWLLPWQEQLIRDIFGIVKPDGYRQFRTAFVEICKKVGKSELAAAVALYQSVIFCGQFNTCHPFLFPAPAFALVRLLSLYPLGTNGTIL